MITAFGNYNSELKLSVVDSLDHVADAKHSLSVPGAIFYNKHFVSADSNDFDLLAREGKLMFGAEWQSTSE